MSRIGVGPLLFTVIWLFFMVAGQTRLFRDPGTQWHTVVGQRILEQGFTTDEPFSFTFADKHWIPHQWLGEAAMALMYSAAGFDTFLLVTSVALAALFTWLTLRLIRTGFNPLVGCMIAVVMIGTAAAHIHIRPMLVTLYFLAILTAILSNVEAGRLCLGKLIYLLLMYLIWTNIHGGMLGGWVSMALVLGGWIVFRQIGWPSPITARADTLALLLALWMCGAAAVVTPYGFGIFRVWMTILNQPRISELIEEHQPLDLSQPASWALVLLAMMYLFTFAGTLHRKPEVSWFLPLFWLVQAGQHVRHSPLFAVTAFVAITAMWPDTRWAKWLAVKRPDVYNPSQPVKPSPWWAWSVPAVLIAVALALQTSGTRVPVIGAGWAGLDAVTWPVDLIEDVQNIPTIDGRPARVFNENVYGGFLIMHAPQCKIFVDDRAELYGEDFLEEYVRAGGENTADALDRWQRRFGRFEYALLKNDTQYEKVFRVQPNWVIAKRGTTATLFKRIR